MRFEKSIINLSSPCNFTLLQVEFIVLICCCWFLKMCNLRWCSSFTQVVLKMCSRYSNCTQDAKVVLKMLKLYSRCSSCTHDAQAVRCTQDAQVILKNSRCSSCTQDAQVVYLSKMINLSSSVSAVKICINFVWQIHQLISNRMGVY